MEAVTPTKKATREDKMPEDQKVAPSGDDEKLSEDAPAVADLVPSINNDSSAVPPGQGDEGERRGIQEISKQKKKKTKDVKVNEEIRADRTARRERGQIKMMILYLGYIFACSSNFVDERNSQELYYTGAAIKDQLGNSPYDSNSAHNDHEDFTALGTMGDWYNYFIEIVPGKLFSGSDTNDEDDSYPSPDPTKNKGSLLNRPNVLNGFNYIIGAVRFSQLRAKTAPCAKQTQSVPVDQDFTCFSRDRLYEEIYDDARFGYPNDQFKGYPLDTAKVWRSPSTMVSYPDGNYFFDIPGNSTAKDAAAKIQYLRDSKWIDLKTKVAFFDVNLYNPTIRVWVTYRMICEFMPSGGVYPNIEVIVQNPFNDAYNEDNQPNSESTYDIIIIVLTVLFLLETLYSFVDKALKYGSIIIPIDVIFGFDLVHYGLVIYYYAFK